MKHLLIASLLSLGLVASAQAETNTTATPDFSRIAERLEITTEARPAFDAAMQDYAQKRQALWSEFREREQVLTDERNLVLTSVLTDEQIAKLNRVGKRKGHEHHLRGKGSNAGKHHAEHGKRHQTSSMANPSSL